MKSNFKKVALLVAFATIVGTTSSFPAYASTVEPQSVASEKNSIDISKEIKKLNTVPFEKKDDNTQVRSITLNQGLILEEELTSSDIISKARTTNVSTQVTSTVTIKNNVGITAAVLTAIGYFTHNGTTSYATDADSSSSAGAFYTATDRVSHVGTKPVEGFARVTCKYHVKGSIGFEWGNVTISDLNITANVYCNQDGKKDSQWT